MDNQFSDYFKTTVGVRQGCLLSPVLFNLFLERIMNEALDNFDGGVKCAGERITNLRFADDIDLLAETEEDLQELTNRLEETSRNYGMEISIEKSKVMIAGKKDDIVGKQLNITVDGKGLEQVERFTYLGAIITNDGKSEKEVKARIGRSTSTLAKLETT